MTLFVLLIGLSLVGLASVLFVRAVTLSRARAAETLDQIGSYGYTSAAGAPRVPDPVSVVGKLATSLGKAVGSRMSPAREAELRQQLVSAGLYSVEPLRFIGYRMLATILAPLLWLWLETS